jgi:hypothetical protein
LWLHNHNRNSCICSCRQTPSFRNDLTAPLGHLRG